MAKTVDGITVGGEPRRALDLLPVFRESANVLVGSGPQPWELGLAFYAFLFIAGSWFWTRARRAAVLAWTNFVFAAVGLLLVYALASLWVHSLFIHRYFLVPLPFLVLGQAALAMQASAWRRGVAAAAILLLLVPALAFYWPLLMSPGIPYRANPGLGYLEARLAPGDAIIFTDIARLGYYHLRNADPVDTHVIHFAGSAFLEDDVAARTAEVVPTLLDRHRRVWLFDSQPGKEALKAQLHAALGEPLRKQVVLQDDFSYAEITCFAGRSQ